MEAQAPVSVGSRLRAWLVAIPLTTRSVALFCSLLFVLDAVQPFVAHEALCLSPKHTLENFSIHRVFASPFLHHSLLHVALNMSAWISLAGNLERNMFGTLQFAWLVLLLVWLTGFLTVVIANVAGSLVWIHLTTQCSVGLSGVIFALLVIHCHLAASPVSVLGFLQLNARIYPVVMLFLMQLILPNVSFVGHLAGVLVGYLYLLGMFNVLLLSPATLNWIESRGCTGLFIGTAGYVVNPNLGIPTVNRGATSAGNFVRSIGDWFSQYPGGTQPSTAAQTMSSAGPGSAATSASGASASAPAAPASPAVAFPGQGRKVGYASGSSGGIASVTATATTTVSSSSSSPNAHAS